MVRRRSTRALLAGVRVSPISSVGMTASSIGYFGDG
jgi:hypothetical protein